MAELKSDQPDDSLFRAIKSSLAKKRFREAGKAITETPSHFATQQKEEPDCKSKLSYAEIFQIEPCADDDDGVWLHGDFSQLRRYLSYFDKDLATIKLNEDNRFNDDKVLDLVKEKIAKGQGGDVLRALHELISLTPNMVNKKLAPHALALCATFSPSTISLENKVTLRANAFSLLSIVCEDGDQFLSFVNLCYNSGDETTGNAWDFSYRKVIQRWYLQQDIYELASWLAFSKTKSGQPLSHKDILKIAAPRRTGAGQGDFQALMAYINLQKSETTELNNLKSNLDSVLQQSDSKSIRPGSAPMALRNRDVVALASAGRASSGIFPPKMPLTPQASRRQLNVIVKDCKEPAIISYVSDLSSVSGATTEIAKVAEIIIKRNLSFNPHIPEKMMELKLENKPIWDALCQVAKLIDVIRYLNKLFSIQLVGREEWRMSSSNDRRNNSSSSYSSISNTSGYSSGSSTVSSSSRSSHLGRQSSATTLSGYGGSETSSSHRSTPTTSSQSSPTSNDKKFALDNSSAILEENEENDAEKVSNLLNCVDADNEETAPVLRRLLNPAAYMQYLSVPPIEFLLALARYQDDRLVDLKNNRIRPLDSVVNALEKGFRMSASRIESTRKRIMILLDCRTSMEYHKVTGEVFSCRSVTAAICRYFLNTEPNVDCYSYTMNKLNLCTLAPEDPLQKVMKSVNTSSSSILDVTKAYDWLSETRKQYDAVIVITDDSADYTGRSPAQAVRDYRRSADVIGSRFIIINLLGKSKKEGLVDPKDPGMLEVMGFNADTVDLLRIFMRGLI